MLRSPMMAMALAIAAYAERQPARSLIAEPPPAPPKPEEPQRPQSRQARRKAERHLAKRKGSDR